LTEQNSELTIIINPLLLT